MKNQVFRNRFLAILGPIWAYNRPNRGHGWPRLLVSCRFGVTNLHFGAKTLDCRHISLQFSRIWGSLALGNPERSQFWAKGNHSLSTCRFALKKEGRDQTQPDQTDRQSQTSQTEPARQTELTDRQDGTAPAASAGRPGGLCVMPNEEREEGEQVGDPWATRWVGRRPGRRRQLRPVRTWIPYEIHWEA